MKQTQDILTKPKLIPTTKSGLTAEQKAMVDRMAEIKLQLADMKSLADEAEKLRKQLLDVADLHFTPHEQAVLNGNESTVIFSAKCETRVVSDMQGVLGVLKQKIGYDGLLQLVKLNIGDIENYLSPAEYTPFLKTIMGNRVFKGYTISAKKKGGRQ